MTTGDASVILRTKLYAPPMRADLTPRPRLLERLDEGLTAHHKLTLVSAPAGYGKTTLVASWIAQTPEREPGEGTSRLQAAWLSLDANDNDVTRFVSHWLAAIRSAGVVLGEGTTELLALSPLPPLTTIVDLLLNDLLASESPLVVVLDDYHVITNPQIHEALAHFIDHQPGPVHLVLTSREDPPLPLARLRARAQLTEIRAQELRFTFEEARLFFRESMGLELDAEDVDTLEARTEGWAAGLQLAALALQHLPNRRAFLADFGGSHRYVIEYLAEEVIRQQDEATRRFLTRTAVLDRLCGPLCDALLDGDDGPPPDTVLRQLEKANLFLIPLDGEQRWYRYHHLFADYLRVGLEDAERAVLCKRAAAWHEGNASTPEAVQYALRSGDSDYAADVIARAMQRRATWSQGQLTQWLSWLRALPSRVYIGRPQLSLDASRVLYLSGRFDAAEEHLAQIEEGQASLPDSPERETFLALAALYRGAISAVRGHAERAIEQITYAQPQLPEDNHLVHARAHFSLGLAYELIDDSEQAVESYLRASERAQEAEVLFLAVHGLCAAAQVQIRQGRLRLAEVNCGTALGLIQGKQLPPFGLAWSLQGEIALERNDLAGAEALLEKGIALSRRGGLLDDVAVGLTSLARLRAYQDDGAGALAIVEEARAIVTDYGIQYMELLLDAQRARLHLWFGETAAAERWVSETLPLHNDVSHPYIDLSQAHVWLATGKLEHLPTLLNPLLDKANAAGRGRTVIEALILMARYYQERDDRTTARARLEQALRLAAPEGYARVFLDHGERLHPLLSAARAAAPEFVDRLLGAPSPEEVLRSARLARLPEPLTDQEVTVLALLVSGKSNQEIAEKLSISVGTAKWHVHNVLQKLDVSNRTQAAAKARDLKLV